MTGYRSINAVAESFFATLRAELVDHERLPIRKAAIAAIGDYIDNFYNAERRHSHLGYLNPIEFELRSQLQQHVAYSDCPRNRGRFTSLLPIAAYRPQWFMSAIHIDPEGAVLAHLTLESQVSIAMHFGIFAQADNGRY